MFDNTIQQPDAMVDFASPLNRDYGPNQGIISRLLTIPGSGERWRDISYRHHGSFGAGTASPRYGTAFEKRNGTFGCLYFDGSDDYVNVPALPSGNGLTWSVWANLRSAGSFPMLITYNAASFWELRYEEANRRPGIYWGGVSIVSPDAVPLGTWNQIGLTISKSGDLRLYVNGVQKAQSTVATFTAIPTIDIGRRYSSVFNFPGLMDDVCIWNRALSTGEYKAFFNDSVNGYPESLNWTQSYRLSDVIGGGGGFQAYWARRQSQFIGGGLI